MEKRRVVTMSLLLVLTVALTACLGSDFEASVEGSWQLESGSLNGEPITIVDTHPITMTLEAGEISGTAACNTYGGQYTLSAAEFTIGESLSYTEMACQPNEVMESERQFLDALLDVDEASLVNGGLTLQGPDTELSFVQLDS